MYISPLSFQGKYRAYYTDPTDGTPYKKAKKYTEMSGGKVEAVRVHPDSKGYYPKSHGQNVYLIGKADCPVPLAGDLFQGFCKTYDVKYIEEGDESLLEPEGIRQRMNKGGGARNTAFLADFDVEKFEQAMQNQVHTNLDEIEDLYAEDETRKKIDEFVLSGLDIPAPTLYITPRGTHDVDELASSIQQKGMKNIDNEALDVEFKQITDESDQCLYCAMKKFGLNTFPVCVMEDTYKIGAAAGFLTPYEKPEYIPRFKKITY